MFNVKLKSVFKFVCCVKLIVILCFLEGKYKIVFKDTEKPEMTGFKLFSSEFEVFGKVQGVFFRKNTEDTANRLGIRGWCMNTKEGTVKGVIEGPQNVYNEMRHWLEKTGSPQSKIEKATFSEPKILNEYSFQDFEIRRVKK